MPLPRLVIMHIAAIRRQAPDRVARTCMIAAKLARDVERRPTR